MSILFGPVPSRRLGRSLGVDMVPYKTCSFNCVYCELGGTTNHTIQRQSFLDIDLVCRELKERLPQLQGKVDYITLAGSGEPTLNLDLKDLVAEIKNLTSTPIAVLTNSSLLPDPEVRKELQQVDLIVPSLDAVTQKIFEQVNQPVKGIKSQEIVQALIDLRKEFQGQIWLEVLFCAGINDSMSELNLLHEAVKAIRPDRIQINSVFRPPAIEGILACTPEKLQQISTMLSSVAEVVGQPHLDKVAVSQSRSFKKRILELLKRRPCTLSDIVRATGISHIELVKILDTLIQAGFLQIRSHEGQAYYQFRSEETEKQK